MSSEPRISDEEMQYFQFKARQMFLLQKEDHEWNQFCKKNTCSCCLCQGPTGNKIPKEVGIQASSANISSKINRNIITRTGVQNRNLPQTLNEIKTKLDKIDLSLSRMHMSQQNEIIPIQLPDIQVPISSSASGKNTMNEKRLEIIQNTLKGSLQRLQSTATWKGKQISSMNGQKKSSGFFLPHDLQEQRVIARRAYLASLAKLGNKNQATDGLNSGPRAGNTKNVNQKQIKKSVKNLPKSRGKNNLPPKKEESTDSNIITAVQSSEIKDENIENAIDAVIDDLLGETVLSINKIRHNKMKKRVEHVGEVQMEKSKQECKISQTTENLIDEEDSHNQQKSHWEKIRGNLFKMKSAMAAENSTSLNHFKLNITEQYNSGERSSFQHTFLSHNTIPKTIEKQTPELGNRTNLLIDSKSVKEISNQRKEFWKYLERISRTKKGNFDPWTLSNMVAETILDDCILDVCQELQDVPTSLITELYDQEFLQSL